MPPNKIDQFRQDMLDAGYEVTKYSSSDYKGPAVIVERKADIQDIIRATSVRLDWHPWGKLSYIVWAE